MADPWSLTLAALALLGQAPSFVGSWQKLIGKLKRRNELSPADLQDSEVELLQAREDWLFHKIILLDLVIGFSLEHQMPEEIVRYCKTHRPQVMAELKDVKQKLTSLRPESPEGAGTANKSVQATK